MPTPNPKSYDRVLGDMIATYNAKIGVNDNNPGSAVISFFEAHAQAVYRASADTFSILRDFNVDRAEGEALKRIAEEERIFPLPSVVATGRVTITDTSFNKISTKVYAGTTPPNIGSTEIFVSDASEFPATGSIYIGRGTSNIEGPIAYTSIDQLGSFFRINLAAPTSRYHNNNESVILSQGGVRNVPVGTGIQTVGGGSSPQITFSTTQVATILDGEVEITNVPVAAQEPGIDGNVPANSIKEFVTIPFTGANVTNPSAFTTGRSEESDEEIRARIKKGRISKGLGTATAIKETVKGAQASDESAIITSTEILSTGDRTTLFVDNGQGYEEISEGVGLEFIVDSALGGEQFFKLATGGRQTGIVKAFIASTETAPFNLQANDVLAILVGGVLNEHSFGESDFSSPGAATAFEVVASVNANSNINFSARTIDNGTRVKFFSREEENEFIQKTNPSAGTDAGAVLGLPSNEEETLKLFKNRKPLSRNGRSAVLESEDQASWSNTIANGDTLIVAVDGTQSVTYTFTNDDFAAEGTHTTVSKNNTLQSWVNVINAKITGVTASLNGTRILLSSNLGTNSRASVVIDSASTLVSKGMFTLSKGLSAFGDEADYTLSRNTAQFKLTNPLEAGDSLTSGSDETEGSIESGEILGGQLTLSDDAELWFIVDDSSAALVTSGAIADTQLTLIKQPGNILRFRSNQAEAFTNIQAGDYVILWSEEFLPVNRLEGRVYNVGTDLQTNDYFELRVTTDEYNAASAEGPIDFVEGLKFVRTETTPQKVLVTANTYTVAELAAEIESQALGVSARTINDEIILLATKNSSTDGSIFLVTFNDPAKNLNFTEGVQESSNFSLIGSVTSAIEGIDFPLFVHSSFTSDRSAQTPTNFITDVDSALDLDAAQIDPDAYIAVQHPYLSAGSAVNDAQAADERVLIDNIAGTNIDIDQLATLRQIRTNDRYYLLRTLDLAHNDQITLILDNDAANRTFPVNLNRTALTNPSMPVNADQFRAFDDDGGTGTEFTEFFGNDYSFKNYKALMQAKNAIDPTSATDEDAILYRSVVWGSAGEKYKVGYFYPTSANQDITHTTTIGEFIENRIRLKSGDAVPNTIDGTTEWDITITPNSPVAGVEEVTYTWNGTGTNPTMLTLSAGDYVTINANGEFDPANIGTYRISAANPTSFTIRRPNGEAVAETGVATLANNTIALYEDSDTTAQEIVDYVTNNMAEFITATILDDNGTAGAGIIGLSTYEDNDFAVDTDFVTMLDGINWIETSDLDAVAPAPQFELKQTLDLPNFNTNTLNAYAFNNSENVKLVPTSIPQVVDMFNVLAVTGFTTLGEVSTADRERRLQLSTQVLGSGGSVLVSGGTANDASATVLGVAQVIQDSEFSKITIARSASGGIQGGSILKLQASNKQRKLTGISFTTNVEITPNTPDPTSSTILLGNQDLSDRYFGEPRNAPRTRGRAFSVEKHGSLVCIAWDETTGTDPLFTKAVELNDSAGNVSVDFNGDSLQTEYTIDTGTVSFIELSIGDDITFAGFANEENNGTFQVTGISDDGSRVSTTNDSGVIETAAIGLGQITATTSVKEGDTVEIAAPFTNLNQGTYRVVRLFNSSIYIENDSAVEERVTVTDNLRALGFDATTEFDVSVPGHMRIEWNTNGTQPTLANAKMGDVVRVGTAFSAANQGDFMVASSGDNFIELKNANAVNETAITVTGVGGDVLQAQIPALKFSEYEATVPGDNFVISGSVLGDANQGSFTVLEVLSKNSVSVDAVLDAVSPAEQLNDLFVQVYVEEGVAYTAYKKVHTVSTNPASDQQTCLVIEGTDQIEKINETASIAVVGQSKLSFPETTTSGFDSYKYYEGLLGEANRIVYGDPADNITYPGVAAAGAEIFIEPPLVKRIEVSINVRVNTGTPFARVTEEVRNAIAALINASPIGESIAISDIISQVNSIPGVRAVSISSPAYDPSNDVIVVNPSEKPFILDIVKDITVSKVE